MPESRPNPDELLTHLKAEEARAARGRLRIFFGAVAGVGKTYAMLEAARGRRATGTDIVIGYIEPHGRADTERLMEGLEQLATLPMNYRGVVRQELNLDAALKRRPAILLVDELAHSNPIGADPPPRHPKRWQDIEEILAAGIDVWTTVNVQHLESLNDVVAQITGVRQRETLPDRVFDEADEVELIDCRPMSSSRVYAPARSTYPRTPPRRPSSSFVGPICSPCASSRFVGPRTVSRPLHAQRNVTSPELAAGSYAIGSSWQPGRTRSPNKPFARANVSPMRSMPSGRWCTSRPPRYAG